MAGKTILTPFQTKVFNRIIEDQFFQENFYFSGGTALAEFYLQHRYSNDLDFFTDKEVSYQTILSKLKPEFEKMGIDSFEYREQAGMKLFFFKKDDGQRLKVDFNYFPFTRLDKFKIYKEFKVDSFFDLAINKVNLILTRTNIRDYVDFYFIQEEKDYSWREIFKGVKEKFSWDIDSLNLAGKLLKVEKHHDYPEMIKDFSKSEMIEYYTEEAKKLQSEIFKINS